MIEDIKNFRNTIFGNENILARDINDEYFEACLNVLEKFSKDFDFIEYGDTESIKQILSDIECLFDSELKRQNLLDLVSLAKNAYQNYKKHLQDNAKNNLLNQEEQANNEESIEKTETKQQEQSEEENQNTENKEENNETTNNQKKKPRKNQRKNQKNNQNQENERLDEIKNEANNLSKEDNCLNQECKEENLEKSETKQQEQSEEENQKNEENNEILNNQKKKPRKNQGKKQENQQKEEKNQENSKEQNQEEILNDDELDALEQELNELLKDLEFLNDESNIDDNSDSNNQESSNNQQSKSFQTPQINPKKRDLKNFEKQMQEFFNDRGVGGEKDLVKVTHSYRNDNIKKSEIKRLCKMICEGFGIGVSKNDKHNLGYELDGITSSDILKNALPSEFALLNDELAQNLFFAKFCEKSLSTWLNKSSDKAKISPLIIAIDNSGSMSGAPEMVAKTVGYYLINECKKHRKECILIFATRSGGIKTSKKHGYDELLYALSKYKASGGFDIDLVLKESLKKAREYNNKANLLAISDFCIGDVYLKDIEDELNAVKSYALFISFFGGNRFDVKGFHKYFLYDNYNHTINVLERKDREEKLKRK